MESKRDGTKFYRIILDPKSSTLKFPRFFVRIHGKHLLENVILKVADGREWEVKIRTNSDGEIVIYRGLKKFRKFYSVELGNFLTFTYDKTRGRFHVAIFDLSCLEIKYPSQIIKAEEEDSSMDECEPSEDEIMESSPEECRGKVLCRKVQNDKGKRITKIKSKAYSKARAFQLTSTTKNAMYVSIMQPTYVSDKFGLWLPVKFAQKNVKSRDRSLALYDDSGKEWGVSCYIGVKNAKINKGWDKVVAHHKLKVGDVCVFEVIHNTPHPMWKVFIFKE